MAASKCEADHEVIKKKQKPRGAAAFGPGPGRPKGVPNKATKALKDAILHAFDKVGGASYLERIAESDPKTFCTLLGKVLPLTINSDSSTPLNINLKLDAFTGRIARLSARAGEDEGDCEA